MNILLIAQNSIDTTSFYRANGVFGNLSRQMKNLTIHSTDVKNMKLSWADLLLYDLVFMQRPYDNICKHLAAYIKDLKIPLWIDYDDNLLALPSDNPSFYIYNSKQIKQNIIELLSMADFVSVSTQALKVAFSPYSKNISVIENAINLDIFSRSNKKQNDTFLWRGSETHQIDLMTYIMELTHSISTFKNWKWHFYGYYPWMLINPSAPFYHSAVTDIIPYHKDIQAIAPKCMIIPLADHNFNRCKSNIAALEGILAGAVCVVPDWPEWQIPGTLKYKNQAEFQEQLDAIYYGNINTTKLNSQAWEYICDTYSLSKINQKRIEILKSI